MTEQTFYLTPPSIGAVDGGYFPQAGLTGLHHSYPSTGGSTELPSPPYPQPTRLSPPESPCAGPGPPRPAGGPWLQPAPLWESEPAGGAVAQGERSTEQYQPLDSFPNAFANHSLRLLPGSAPCLDMPRPFCRTKPTDVVLQQLLSHKPQQTQIQPMAAQQSQPISSCSQGQGSVLSQHGYLLQEQYCPLQEQQDMNYLLYSRPHAGPARQTSYPSHPTANPALQTTNPAQTHTDPTHSFANPAHPAQLTPPFSSPYGHVSNAQLYSHPEPAPLIPQTHFYYQNQNPNHLPNQAHLPSHDPNQNHHMNHNYPIQNPNQTQHQSESHLNHTQDQNQNQNRRRTAPASGLRPREHAPPLPCDQYGSDSSCPALLSPAHLSPLDPSPAVCQPHPLLPAANHSSHQQRSEVEFHAPAPPSCCSPGAPQWRQMCSAVLDQPSVQEHSVLLTLMGKDVPRLLCSVCQKEFKSLPALNGHMRSHGGGVPPKPQPLKMGRGSGAGPDKRSRSHSEPLLSPSLCGAVLFQSLLRPPPLLGQAPPYTPPPMLHPSRQGSGLYSNICPAKAPPTRTPPPLLPPRVLLNRTSSLDCSVEREISNSGEKLSQIKPRINIGPQFQALIPEVQRVPRRDREPPQALPLWSPWGGQEIADQQKVDALLNMACSSILPGGGTNSELALHCLFQCRGDLMATLDRLLMQKPVSPQSPPLADYHYAGSDNWTLAEKKQLNRAFILHNKDFFLIQKMVKTKTVCQCVEYYYTWKKRLRLGKRQQVRTASLGSERGVHTPQPQDVQEEGCKSAELGGVQHEVKAHWSPGLDSPVANEIGGFGCDILARSSNSSTQHALGPAEIRSQLGSAPKSPAERILCSPPLQLAPDSAPAVDSASPSSADAAHIFPCRECGKVFLKIKSRNAHMKTHRQQDDPQDWLLRPVSHPAGPAPPPPPVSHLGLTPPLCMQGGEEEEEDPFLPVHDLLQMEAGPFISVEEL